MAIPPSELIGVAVGVVAVAAVVGVIIFLYRREPERVARRELSKTPSVPIASAVPGRRHKITGTVRARGGLATALHGDPCVHVHTSLWHFFRRKGTDGNVSEKWKIVSQETAGGAFDVVDASGSATTEPKGAFLFVAERWATVDWDNLTASQTALVQRHAKNIEHAHPMKIRELVIRDGEIVSVLGAVQAGDAGKPGVFAKAEKQLLAIESAARPDA